MMLCERFADSVGAKMLMAITGLLLTIFVLVLHLSGQLLIFAGPDVINEYAAKLKSLGPLLWLARGGLLVVFVLHVYLGIKLSLANRKARPVRYAHDATIQASWASRYMMHTGLLTLVFILYHLAHYTFRVVSPEVNAIPAENVYGMLVAGFSSPVVCGFYIVSLAALSLHMSHGVSSLFQSLGINHGNLNPLTRKLGPITGFIVFFGYSSVPLAVLTGFVK